jgi:Dna[CI] antecedent, DciA
MAKRRRLRDAERLGSVLSRDRDLEPAIEVPMGPVSARDWEIAVGSRIAARTQPRRLVRGTLQVMTTSAAWAQELSLLSEGILASLRRVVPEVKALRFQVGNVDPPKEPRGKLVPAPKPVPLPSSIEAALDRISDDDLRAAIRGAASKNLGFDPPARGPRPRDPRGRSRSV